jgi:hypothetical protein
VRLFNRRPAERDASDQVGELRKTLTQSHRLLGRLLGSTRRVDEVDFAGIAEGWLLVSRDFKQLERLVPQLRPLARLEDLVERFERVTHKAGRGAAEPS